MIINLKWSIPRTTAAKNLMCFTTKRLPNLQNTKKARPLLSECDWLWPTHKKATWRTAHDSVWSRHELTLFCLCCVCSQFCSLRSDCFCRSLLHFVWSFVVSLVFVSCRPIVRCSCCTFSSVSCRGHCFHQLLARLYDLSISLLLRSRDAPLGHPAPPGIEYDFK